MSAPSNVRNSGTTPHQLESDSGAADASVSEHSSGSQPVSSTVHDDSAERSTPDVPEMSVRILWCPAMFVLDRFGEDKFASLCRAAGFQPEEVHIGKRWISARQVAVFLQSVRDLVREDVDFEEACLHRLKESYGPIRYVSWATTPKAVLKLAANALRPVLSRVSAYEVVDEEPFGVRLRYTSDVPEHESRLLCTGRRVQAAALPSLWGLPPARVTEFSCIARGDSCCEYHFRWYAKARWFPSALGAIVGTALAALLIHLGLSERSLWIALPMLGAALALVYELRRTENANVALGSEIQQALRALADDASEARHEIFELHQRQQDWTHLLEEQVAERTATVNSIVERIQQLRAQREQSLRGLSHDLRNPMTVMRLATAYLERCVTLTPEVVDALDDLKICVSRMDTILNELMEAALAESAVVRVVAAPLNVPEAASRLARRARAIVYGRDIHVNVVTRPSAPEAIETDLMIFDRVTDNLLTNAAKYTERGSIQIELDGSKPQYLSLEVTDTGRGIKQEELGRIFLPGGSAARSRAAHSFGVGLSVVVQLLAQIGGQLEVKSVLGQGTTFRVLFPTKIQLPALPSRNTDIKDLVARVVHITSSD